MSVFYGLVHQSGFGFYNYISAEIFSAGLLSEQHAQCGGSFAVLLDYAYIKAVFSFAAVQRKGFSFKTLQAVGYFHLCNVHCFQLPVGEHTESDTDILHIVHMAAGVCV